MLSTHIIYQYKHPYTYVWLLIVCYYLMHCIPCLFSSIYPLSIDVIVELGIMHQFDSLHFGHPKLFKTCPIIMKAYSYINIVYYHQVVCTSNHIVYHANCHKDVWRHNISIKTLWLKNTLKYHIVPISNIPQIFIAFIEPSVLRKAELGCCSLYVR